MTRSVFDDAQPYIRKGLSKARIEVSKEIAKQMLGTYKRMGNKSFWVDVGKLNTEIGFNTKNHRRNQILERMQEHNDLLPEGKVWYIGTADNDTKYFIDIKDEPTEDDEEESDEEDNE